ncbi:MAG: hypothetical protein ACRDHZ_07045, partial [Ktedonobacteraceae bacterium]
LEGDAWIYAHSNDPSVSPSSILNPLFDAVVNAISPKVGAFGGAQTLGGLVTSCHVDGEIMYDEGLLGDQAVCKVPIAILVPG